MTTKVTVGVPTLNGGARLQRCLWSISEYTSLDGVRVVVCDDGSTPDNLQDNRNVVASFAERIPGLQLLENGERRGIARSWNRLSRHHDDAQVVALLNDDIEVVEDWLDVLVFSVMENKHAGMVGLNSYCHLTKEYRARAFALDKDGTPLPDHITLPRVDYREAHLLSGGGKLVSSQGPIFAFRRSAFDQVGGFDERYFCFYEETDFGISLRRSGYFHYMSDYPLVYHMGGATNSERSNLDASAVMADSKTKFLTKWGSSFSELRREWGPAPPCVEWNSQVKNWV